MNKKIKNFEIDNLFSETDDYIKNTDFSKSSLDDLLSLYFLMFNNTPFLSVEKSEEEQKLDVIKALKSGKELPPYYVDGPIE